MKVKIRPLGDKILVQRREGDVKTASGIYLPDSAREKPQEATVIRVGDGRSLENGKRAEFSVKEKDTVLLSKWGGTEVKIDDQELLLISEEDILAIVK
ncbi:MAG: co-chaperone GroES [Phycisphaeraceae bacterium]|nr:co-chaperone GroES [Phycisphaeraceae bacterium]